MKLKPVGVVALSGLLLMSCGRTHEGETSAEAQESRAAIKREIRDKLDVELRRFREANGLSEEELAQLFAARAAGTFEKAWFRKGGVIQIGDAYQSRYFGDRNVVLTKQPPSTTWTTADLGERDKVMLVALARGQVLGMVPMPSGVDLRETAFLLFEPDKISSFSGQAISGEFFPREPAR